MVDKQRSRLGPVGWSLLLLRELLHAPGTLDDIKYWKTLLGTALSFALLHIDRVREFIMAMDFDRVLTLASILVPVATTGIVVYRIIESAVLRTNSQLAAEALPTPKPLVATAVAAEALPTPKPLVTTADIEAKKFRRLEPEMLAVITYVEEDEMYSVNMEAQRYALNDKLDQLGVSFPEGDPESQAQLLGLMKTGNLDKARRLFRALRRRR